MIIEMKKINLTGPKSELRAMIDVLKGTRSFEHIFTKHQGHDIEAENKTKDQLIEIMSRTKAVIDFEKKCRKDFSLALKKHKTIINKNQIYEHAVAQFDSSRLKIKNDDVYEIDYYELKELVNRETEIFALIEQMEGLNEKLVETQNLINRNEALIAELKPYINLNVAFNLLHDTNRAFVLAGLMPEEKYLKFKSEFSLDTIITRDYISTENRNDRNLLFGALAPEVGVKGGGTKN